MDVAALVPLQIRLQSLEAQIRGAPSFHDADSAGSTPKSSVASSSSTIIRQMRAAQDTLERISQESEALKRLLTGYEGYKHLLALPGEEDLKDLEASGISDQAKIALLVESRGDLISAERDLREIELLKERGVEGSGDLERLLDLRPELSERIRHAETKRTELLVARKEVMALLKRYRDFSTTVSDLFLELHHRLEALEDDVQRAERRKAKEARERY